MQPDSGQKPKNENSHDTKYFSSQDLTEAKRLYEQAKKNKKAKRQELNSDEEKSNEPLSMAKISFKIALIATVVVVIVWGLTGVLTAISHSQGTGGDGAIAIIIGPVMVPALLTALIFYILAAVSAKLGLINKQEKKAVENPKHSKAKLYNITAWVFAALSLLIIFGYIFNLVSCQQGLTSCGAVPIFVTTTAVPALITSLILAVVFSRLSRNEKKTNITERKNELKETVTKDPELNKAKIYNVTAWVFAVIFLGVIFACIFGLVNCSQNSVCGVAPLFVTMAAVPILIVSLVLAIIFSKLSKKEKEKIKKHTPQT